MFTSKVWTDDSRLLQELNLASRQPQGATSHHTGNYKWRSCQGSYVAARGGVEPVNFRTEGTDYSTNHTPCPAISFIVYLPIVLLIIIREWPEICSGRISGFLELFASANTEANTCAYLSGLTIIIPRLKPGN